jgi:hypothetical protein
MLNDFSTEYSERSHDELLQLASERHSLTTEAASALDAELRRRNLTESDPLLSDPNAKFSAEMWRKPQRTRKVKKEQETEGRWT